VDEAILEEYLRHGLSLERIADLTGRHPSTVGYWVKKYGLSPVYRDRHAPRGGVDRETLATLVEEGLSARQISERLELSQSTVRHWLRHHRLRTHRARRANSKGVRGIDADRTTMECPRHGITEFWLEARGIYRCLRCRSEAVSRRRKKLKEVLVSEAGPTRSRSTGLPTAGSRGHWRRSERKPQSACFCAQTAIRRWRRVSSSSSHVATFSGVARGHNAVPGSSIGRRARLLTERLWVRLPPRELTYQSCLLRRFRVLAGGERAYGSRAVARRPKLAAAARSTRPPPAKAAVTSRCSFFVATREPSFP
jgi:transposase